MRRLAISLLCVVLGATVGAGWALDRLFDAWGGSATEPLGEYRALGRSIADLIERLDAKGEEGLGEQGVSDDVEHEGDEAERQAETVEALAAARALDIALVRASELGLDDAALLDAIGDRLGLALESADGVVTVYYALGGGGDTLLALTHPLREGMPIRQLALTLGFYLALLLLVLAWLLPLLRRLARLTTAARAFGHGHLDTRVATRPRSELHVVESAFNAMASRLGRLVDDNRLLGRGVAHDLKTPLARLRFGIDSLEELDASRPDIERVRTDHLTRLQTDLDAMEGSLNAMLDYARHDVREDPAPHRPIRLHAVVADRVETWRVSADVTVSRGGESLTIEGDERQLITLVDNLVRNAIQHGGGRVMIGIASAARNTVELRVEDDGDGIDESQHVRVFEPFTRGHGAASGGHGLGLALVMRIAERHRASCAIGTSALGGASLTVRFPLG